MKATERDFALYGRAVANPEFVVTLEIPKLTRWQRFAYACSNAWGHFFEFMLWWGALATLVWSLKP